MISNAQTESQTPQQLADKHMPLAGQITARLRNRYGWIAREDLYSYALLGLTMAAEAFEPERGVPFAGYAARKAMYWAIDEMRKDGVLVRSSCAKNRPRMVPIGDGSTDGAEDEPGMTFRDARSEDSRRRMEARDMVASLLNRLNDHDRKLLLLYYTEEMTFAEIARVFELSESSICLRHKAILKKLRRIARAAQDGHYVSE